MVCGIPSILQSENSVNSKLYVFFGSSFLIELKGQISCIEGDDAIYLDGVVENFSGINIFNEKDKHIAGGWMEFIYEPTYNFFISYWGFLTYLDSGKEIEIKDKVGIPLHIFNQILENVRYRYKTELLK